MKKMLWVIALFMLVNSAACSNPGISKQDSTNYKQMYEETIKDQAPLIKDITFKTLDGKVIEEDDNWFCLDKQVKIIVTLEGDCQEVDLFVTPSGSATYQMQQLIDVISPKHNLAEYVWNVPDDTMGHFNLIAYNGDVGRRSDLYNVVSKSGQDTSQKP